jgi:hypothetical protein
VKADNKLAGLNTPPSSEPEGTKPRTASWSNEGNTEAVVKVKATT